MSDQMADNGSFLTKKWVIIAACGGAVATAALAFYIRKKMLPTVLLRDSTVKYALPLAEKIIVSHNTRLFRFALPSKSHSLGIPVGQHVYLSAKVDGKVVVRPYTPITLNKDKGHMDLVIKVYFKNEHPKFPDGGKMSQFLDSLSIGETIEVRGPTGHTEYMGNGTFNMYAKGKTPAKTVKVKKLAMIAGGTGITPVFQLMREILENASDPTEISLIYGNTSEGDILLRDQLESFQKSASDRFKLWYTLSKPPNDWPYSTGHINANMLREHFPRPSSDVLVLMCGPPPMIDNACTPVLDKLGYDVNLRYIF